MSLDESISAYIASIYEAPTDEMKWEQMVDRLLEITDSHVALISAVDTRDRVFHRMSFRGSGATPRALEEYASEMYPHDPSFQWATENPQGRFCDTSRLMPEEEYRSNPFMRWNLDRLGSSHWCVGFSSVGNGVTLGVSLHPHASVGPMPASTMRLFRMLYDHIENAVTLAVRPLDLDGHKEAIILLDCRAEVWRSSPAAAAILAEGDPIFVDGERLRAVDKLADVHLQAAVRSALDAFWDGGSGGGVLLPRGSGLRPYMARISPLPPGSGPVAPFQPTVMIRLVDPACRPTGQSALYAELFGLTRREAELAELLMVGHSIDSVAVSLGISPSTARIHLRGLFRKTMTCRQTDLIRLLNSIA